MISLRMLQESLQKRLEPENLRKQLQKSWMPVREERPRRPQERVQDLHGLEEQRRAEKDWAARQEEWMSEWEEGDPC